MDYRIFGCKTNKYFTDKWLSDPDFAEKPGIFVASCVVTENAKRKWRKFVKKAALALPEGGKIYLSGCGSLNGGEVSARFYEEYPDLLPFRDRIELLPEDPDDSGGSGSPASGTGIRPAAGGRFGKPSPADRIRSLKSAMAGKNLFTRKYCVVQTGCDNFCTFCLTVAARGRHKWRPEAEIVEEIRQFADAGGAEVVLTGTNVGAWGAEDSNRFDDGRLADLVEAIWAGTGIRRVRVSSLGPEFLTDRLVSLFADRRMHAYVHLSVQSGSDAILKRMRRKYGRPFLEDRLRAIRSVVREDGASINIGADLIVGFPGETEADFEDTLSLVRDFGITQTHAFPFSAHEGLHAVPAAKLPEQVPETVKSARMERLLAEAEAVREKFLSEQDGKTMELLPEGDPSAETFSGWSENHVALSETNFIPLPNQEFARGKPVSGRYRHIPGAARNAMEEDPE